VVKKAPEELKPFLIYYLSPTTRFINPNWAFEYNYPELIRLVIESECIETLSPYQAKTRYTEEEGGMGGRRDKDRDRAYQACHRVRVYRGTFP
jgi:hypothetical protein